jgi:hypothetical protein
MYVRDLIWVWSGWDDSITSQHILQVRVQENHLLPLRLWLGDQAYIRLGLNNMTTSHNIEVLKHIIYVWIDLIWVWIGLCLIYDKKHNASKNPSELPTTTTLPLQEQYQAGAASLLLLATATGAETLYTYKLDLLWVWSVWGGVLIIRTNTRESNFDTKTKDIHSQVP